ncbi:activating signal cointegrator 1 complex subunit 3 [Trichonephila clavata]|uniref:Activating signal cointegrator 1 complex subunit 3 n=1 Tax=Trichonephila clavata TaxID=2740835 RepID=A0A8X6J8T1_TRICU|nr:activating signal cointegrator 1 complex subunit 3 [Trichonephila clavata]
MLRSDRNLVERYFREGLVKVLVCTSTLAWGVNLPARAVIIKGTELYDSKRGAFVDLNFLDVMQIFGRAGRPQFDKKGEGIIITPHDRLAHYLSLLTRQHQIESKFDDKIADNLNAEKFYTFSESVSRHSITEKRWTSNKTTDHRLSSSRYVPQAYKIGIKASSSSKVVGHSFFPCSR